MTKAFWNELSFVTEQIEQIEWRLGHFTRGSYREHLERQLRNAKKRKAALIAALCDGARLDIGIRPAAAHSRR